MNKIKITLKLEIQRAFNGLFSRKTIFFKGSRVGPTFTGGPIFSGGGGGGGGGGMLSLYLSLNNILP